MARRLFLVCVLALGAGLAAACGGGQPTPAPQVTSAPAVAPTLAPTAEPATTQASPPTATPAPEPTATTAAQESPPASPTPAPTPPSAGAGGLTAQEFYDLALAKALEQHPDAVLSRLDSGVPSPLDGEGRGAGWSAQFYSASAKEMVLASLINGEIVVVSNAYPAAPEITPDMDAVNLDVKGFYAGVAAAAGTEYAEGYDLIAGLRPDVLDPGVPAWTFIYLQAGQPVPVYTVILDARSGQVLRAAPLQ